MTMSLHRLIQPRQHLEDEIRQDVIEIRRILPQLGYGEVTVFQEGRGGLLYCALWERVAGSGDGPLAVGYARVSTILQSNNHSLVTQVRQQLELAQTRGHDLRYLYIDAGFTGRDDRRPAFSRMMRHVIRDKDIAFNYIYDVYRFYRNLHGLTTHYATLQENKVELVSAADRHTNYASRDGKLLLYLKGIMGEMYLDDLSRTTRDNKFSRARDGYSNASWPPFGYCRGRCLDCVDPNGQDYCPRFSGPELWRELGDDPKVFVPHPIESVAVRLAAEWYATGQYSDKDIAQGLNRYRHRVSAGTFLPFRPKGRPGRPGEKQRFRKDSVRDLLQNPYHAGFVRYRPTKKKEGLRHQAGKHANPLGQTHTLTPADVIWFPGRHTPLISQELFERCLQVRGAKGHLPHSRIGRTARVYPLSGLLRCVRCSGTFRGTAARGNIRYYEDAERAQGVSDCPIRSVRAEKLEDAVFAYVQRLHIPRDWYPDILAYLQDDRASQDRRRQRRSLESQLRAIRAQFEIEAISQSEHIQAKRRVEHELQRLSRHKKDVEEGLATLLDDFPRLWEAATPLEKKALLRAIFLDIHVLDGEITAYVPRSPFTTLFPTQ
jgi:DNA invertase Pin-like site-specific DNA recombinase